MYTKFFGILMAALLVFGYGGLDAAFAGSQPDIFCDACAMYQKLENQQPKVHKRVVKKKDIKKTTTVVRKETQKRRETVRTSQELCVWLLNKEPTAVVLRKGANNKGPGILGWNTSGWQPSRYYPGFMTKQVCFQAKFVVKLEAVSYCGDVGWQQLLRGSALSELIRRGSIPQSEPVCIAGHACPAGLR